MKSRMRALRWRRSARGKRTILGQKRALRARTPIAADATIETYSMLARLPENATLVTLDRRALPTYQRIGAVVELVA